MASVMRHTPPKASPSSCYLIRTPVEYCLIEGDRTVRFGRTKSLSRNRVVFEAENCVPPDALIEVRVAWPVRLENKIPLNLVIVGSTVQTNENEVAVDILRHEFRTRPVSL